MNDKIRRQAEAAGCAIARAGCSVTSVARLAELIERVLREADMEEEFGKWWAREQSGSGAACGANPCHFRIGFGAGWEARGKADGK